MECKYNFLYSVVNYLHQISISKKGGVPKLPVKSVYVSKNGLVGDKHKHKQYHGGPERAVCLFSLDVIEQLQTAGHPIFPGSTGENLTIRYHDYFSLHEGIKLQIGEEVVIEIVSYTEPCITIRNSFVEGDFNIISQKYNPGNSRLYARVLQQGWINKGDVIQEMK